MAPLSFAILSRLVKTPYVSLPNLLAGEALVPELLQNEAVPEKLGAAVMEYVNNSDKSLALSERFYQMHQTLRRGASARAADAIARLLEERNQQSEPRLQEAPQS
jgi:lipid-A-disaccharide synthase